MAEKKDKKTTLKKETHKRLPYYGTMAEKEDKKTTLHQLHAADVR